MSIAFTTLPGSLDRRIEAVLGHVDVTSGPGYVAERVAARLALRPIGWMWQFRLRVEK